jgi:hypothetical protein
MGVPCVVELRVAVSNTTRPEVFMYYLFTPWSRVLLEKVTVNSAASQEIPRIYGARKFLTITTSARKYTYTRT